ncbi:Structural maintenance of chromosomes protein 3 [Astathelohania contejeani]|uniref:Structural maintenance of chromosomes protein 3 n=1 Tax=Astathelohania contejeani TaxID=164912 RepID=A0ABQ7HYI9_9MICR|nr:Structural maintenance of chromosomes protein 3 [Thelohania contejeani]
MHIIELTLSGFKSFPTPTTITPISPRCNILVGKNGSGKSNIITALQLLLTSAHERLSSEERKALLYEGNNLSTLNAVIEAKLANPDGRFPAGKEVVLRRVLGLKRDEYFVDGKIVPSEDIAGLFESCGLSQYYVVPQGRIQTLAMLDSEQRLSLIKEVAGALVYETDRAQCISLLEQTKETESKIQKALLKIEERISLLETEKKKAESFEKLETEKRAIECAIYEKELKTIETSIEQLDTETSIQQESDSDSCSEELGFRLQTELEELIKEKNKLEIKIKTDFDIDYKTLLSSMDKVKEEKKEIENEISNLKKRQNKLTVDEEETEIDLESKYFEYEYFEILFAKKTFSVEDEINKAKAQLTKKEKEFLEIKTYNSTNKEELKSKLAALIEKRKEYWREERKVDEQINSYSQILMGQQRRLLMQEGNDFSTYQELKGSRGVHGYVYELIDIPEELYVAVEAIAGNLLYSVVVDDEEVATELIRQVNQRITFIPLNRIKKSDPKRIEDDNLILLADQIKCEDRYRAMLNFIINNTYLVSNVKTGAILSKSYGINIVTVEGDIVSKRGILSGGYKKKNNHLKELKKVMNDLYAIQKRKDELKQNISKIDAEVKEINDQIGEIVAINCDKEYKKSIRAILRFLKNKIMALRGNLSPKHLVKVKEEKNNLKIKKMRISNELRRCESELETLIFKLKDSELHISELESKIEQAELIYRKAELENRISEIKELHHKAQSKSLFENIRNTNYEYEKNLCKKNILIEKKNNIFQKIGILSTSKNEKLENLKIEELYAMLSKINEECRKYQMVSKRAVSIYSSFVEQRRELGNRMEELKQSRGNIESFIFELDAKKGEAISLTFSQIQNNFSYFFKRLSPGNNAELILVTNNNTPTGVEIRINSETFNHLKHLSGGQKTIIALSLIFSIQRVDPSPFYIFDEIDANLDHQACERVCEMIFEMSKEGAQFISTTFRENMLNAGEKFYGVKFENKKSIVEEIKKEEAFGYLAEPLN